MRSITIHLLKPGKHTIVTYRGELLLEEPGHLPIHARWERDALDLGYIVFEPGDHFYEHYYTERWFNIFELYSAAGAPKGWYCNVTRPAQVAGDVIMSEDLELDLFVAPDRAHPVRLDLDEFEGRGLAATDPAAYAAALTALDELERMARAGEPPFDGALLHPTG
jgi:predicted RNA-binding protein associated with RNAse of E/G family